MSKRDTSWQKVSKWYGSIVGEKGHFFHQTLVIPNCLRLLNLRSGDKVLDIACGQGVLGRKVPKEVIYTGFDASKSLIDEAKKTDKNPKHKYFTADATRSISEKGYNKATILLALQNIKEADKAIKNVSDALIKGGELLIVLNHPSFRIPRQSSWEEDKTNKMQYRRINRYMTPMEIPINMHPGKENSPITWSFHHPLQDYSKYLFENNFLIEKIEEWTSEKESKGKAARMENRARDEFPMFMAILAKKQ